MKTLYCFVVLFIIAAFAVSAETCLSTPRLIFDVPPVKFILCPDVNSDGQISLNDVIAVSRSFGAISGSPNWNSKADLSGDERVDILDLAMIASVSNATT